jgi:hypothetical protein
VNETELHHLIAAHARFPAALLAVSPGDGRSVAPCARSRRPLVAAQILAHLRDEEIEDFRPRAMAIVEGRPIEKPIDPVRWVVERRYNEMDPGGVFLDWASERADSCRWLETLAPADLQEIRRVPAARQHARRRLHRRVAHARPPALAPVRNRGCDPDGARYGEWRVRYAGTIPGS